MSTFDSSFDELIAESRSHRQQVARRRTRAALGISVAVALAWVLFVTINDHWGRVADNWASAATMTFGSFVAGSTPQGGGAVAFPVFTKILGVDASVARSFSLCIQATGMVVASLSIVINRRPVAWRAVGLAIPPAILGFFVGVLALSDSSLPFWPSTLPGSYVKVFFTLLIASMALMVYLGYRVQIIERIETVPIAGMRVSVLIVVAAFIGGVASAIVGSGADVMLYLAIVVVIGVSPRVSVPSSVIVMATVSVVGLFTFGVVDGQLDVALDPSGDVVAVGGEPVTATDDDGIAYGEGEPLEPIRYDLFGFWLAAIPVAVFGAPLGAWASSKVTDRQLVRFVVALALAEVIGTVFFLEGLLFDPDAALITFAVVGGLVMVTSLVLLKRYRRQILGLPPVDIEQSFTRDRLDTGPGFREQLLDEDQDGP
ncbi:MAG: sulfite exporter TauE/SafE family protein [Acidimicrobiales bacterium]